MLSFFNIPSPPLFHYISLGFLNGLVPKFKSMFEFVNIINVFFQYCPYKNIFFKKKVVLALYLERGEK